MLSGLRGLLPEVSLADLWRSEGTLHRGQYAFLGAGLFLLKHNIDRAVAALWGRPWRFPDYIFPFGFDGSRPKDVQLFVLLLAISVPFIWSGIVLTMRRLRALMAPAWLAVLFFLPAVNLIFFLVLCLIPSRPLMGDALPRAPREALLFRLIPDHPLGSAAFGMLFTVPLSFGAVLLSTYLFRSYGWALFVGIPFCQGLASVLLFAYHSRRDIASCLGVSALSALILGAFLVGLAVEGVFCVTMAAPIGIVLAAMGGAVGFVLQSGRWDGAQTPSVLLALGLGLPCAMGAERSGGAAAPLFSVATEVEIAADSEAVWDAVIQFPELPPPQEWLFRNGISYPVRAEISGRGVGAVRRCVFNTGDFIEPITAYEEGRLLKFDVTGQPLPMREKSPYDGLDAPHLKDFLVSKGGEFRLTPLGPGRTRLVGTTWYEHNMWPAAYWRLWSDAIIHRIHLRVLEHIRTVAEAPDAKL